jgi:hypothetical protein
MRGLSHLTADAIGAAASTVPGANPDEIWYPFYDYLAYPTAGQQQLAFFVNPIGAGVTSAPGAAGTKTEADTNMTASGLLPKGNRFFWVGVEVKWWPGSAAARGPAAQNTVGFNWADTYAVMKSGWLRIRIQNRDYVTDGPLEMFPATTRLAGAAALADQTTIAAASLTQFDYATSAGRPYEVVSQFIDNMQGFTCVMFWPAAVATPSGVNGRIGVRLLGRLIRDPQ